MKSSHKFWLVLVLVPLGIVFTTAVLPNLVYLKHPEPMDLSRMEETEKFLNQEADRIQLPPDTEIADRSSLTRHDIDSVFVTREYKTTLNESDFRKDIIKQLVHNGWSDLGDAYERVAKSMDVFCMGGYDAALIQRDRGMRQDEYFYYELTLGRHKERTGSTYYRKALPKECLAE
ncbi:MAG TPA: hypothetical protein VGO50_14615 [Pyrinomonadaceae bacterium]|jgi:hypothetical protein|nr:hypothetical protein [Pyrinomonadaceae bacterium]